MTEALIDTGSRPNERLPVVDVIEVDHLVRAGKSPCLVRHRSAHQGAPSD
jgi:hypothetical protein